MSLQSTQYFLGNTEIIQSFVGEDPVLFDPTKVTPDLSLITSGLRYYHNANELATTSSWSNIIGPIPKTAGFTTSSITYNVVAPSSSYYDFLSASLSNEMYFGTSPILSSEDKTIVLVIKPKKNTDLQILNYMGQSQVSSSIVSLLIVSGNLGYDSGPVEGGGTVVTGGLAPLSMDEWHVIGYSHQQSTGTVTLFADTSFTQFQDANDTNGLYWGMGMERSTNLYSGSVAAQLVYSRKLSEQEIYQNYFYFKQFYS